jgi:hypothetical protein
MIRSDAASCLAMNNAPDFERLFRSVPGLYLVLTRSFTIVAISDEYLRATMTNALDIFGRGFQVHRDNSLVFHDQNPLIAGTRQRWRWLLLGQSDDLARDFSHSKAIINRNIIPRVRIHRGNLASAGSWMIGTAPYFLICQSPAVPSYRLPLRSTPRTRRPYAIAADRSNTSTLGRDHISFGPSLAALIGNLASLPIMSAKGSERSPEPIGTRQSLSGFDTAGRRPNNHDVVARYRAIL